MEFLETTAANSDDQPFKAVSSSLKAFHDALVDRHTAIGDTLKEMEEARGVMYTNSRRLQPWLTAEERQEIRDNGLDLRDQHNELDKKLQHFEGLTMALGIDYAGEQ